MHVTDADPPYAEDFLYGGSGGTWGGSGTTGVCGDPPGAAGQGTVACSGALTCTVTWVADHPNEPPPLRVAAREVATAHWDGDSGNCANGLGDRTVGGQYGKTSTGERWTLKQLNGSKQFTLNLSPSASTALSSGVCGNPAGTAWVSWQVAAQDVDIRLSGLTWHDPEGWRPMVGQQVVATLVCPSWPDNGRSWSVSGHPFADYQASLNGAEVTPYVNGSTAMQTSAFFRAPSFSLFQCNLFLGGPFQQLVKLKRSFTPEKPLSTIAVSIGEVKLGSPEGYIELALLDAPTLGGAYTDHAEPWVGIRFGANPLTPLPWSNSGAGWWHWVQTVSPERFMTVDGQEVPHPNNLHSGLDTSYPFASLGWPAAGGGGHGVGDAPGQGLDPPATSYRVATETYLMYLMYLPPTKPGYESRYVALKETFWYWAGRADWNGSQWTGPFWPAAQWTYTGDFPKQPEWAYVIPPGP